MARNRRSQWMLFPRNLFIVVIVIATGCGTAPTPMTERDPFIEEQVRLLNDGTNAYLEGRYDDAYELLSKHHEGFADGGSYYMLAIVESARGNDDEAWDLIERAALLGHDGASNLLLEGALKEIEYGTAIINDSQRDIPWQHSNSV